MANLRKALLLGVLAATAAASTAGFFLTVGSSVDAARNRVFVDLGLCVAVVVIVFVMTQPTVDRIRMLVEALQALARGERHQRVRPDEFAGLAAVARAVNEVAASLTEGDDPNVGPVQRKPRPGAEKKQDGDAAVQMSDHPELGAVRAHKREPVAPVSDPRPTSSSYPPAPAAEPPPAPAVARPVRAADASDPPATRKRPSFQVASDDVGEPRPSRSGVKESAARTGAPDIERPAQAAASNDTAVDKRGDASLRSDAGDAAQPSGVSSATGDAAEQTPALPTRAEIEALFREFVDAKKGKEDGDLDLDLDAFAQTLLSEGERLIAAHQCKGVRFAVAEQDGEVSLRPRLIR